jgi:hypothetical protein
MKAGCKCGCHIIAEKAIGCCQCQRDYEGKSLMNFKPNACYCDCHKAWCSSITPPVCVCTCNVEVQRTDAQWAELLRKFNEPTAKPIVYDSIKERVDILRADCDYYEKAGKAMESRVNELERKLTLLLAALNMIK